MIHMQHRQTLTERTY